MHLRLGQLPASAWNAPARAWSATECVVWLICCTRGERLLRLRSVSFAGSASIAWASAAERVGIGRPAELL